jgi:hypothetical protein
VSVLQTVRLGRELREAPVAGGARVHVFLALLRLREACADARRAARGLGRRASGAA